MSSILLLIIGIAAMYVSYYFGRIAALNEISEKIEDDITDEEVDKMVGGTD